MPRKEVYKPTGNPVGHPTLYEDTYPQLLIQHMKTGLSYESFGAIVDVSKQTLYDWEKKHPEFLDAKRQGESHARHFWEKAGRDGLYNETFKDDSGMTVSRSINSTVWSLHMKNRFGWRDKQEVTAKVETTDGDAKAVRELVGILKALKEIQ